MAALASRDPDLAPSERTRAQGALESCGACADLFADLVAVSAAIPSAAIPARPREYTLTAADAARLRPRGLRRWLSTIGSARDGVTFPLALGLTTMGIAGLLLATVPAIIPIGMGGAATSQVLSTVGNAVPPVPEAAAPAPAASAAPAEAAAASALPSSGASRDQSAVTPPPDSEPTGQGQVFSGDDGDTAGAGGPRQGASDLTAESTVRGDLTGLSALAVVAGLLLITGLALFALRWTSRRL
jgi:hypothetical protein